MAKPQTIPLSYRWQVLQRVLAAALLGYVVSTSVSVLLALLLPLPDVQAVATASMLSFTIYTLIIIWSFSVRHLRTVWLGLVLCLLISTSLNYVLTHSYLLTHPALLNAGGGF
jgi:hypothetical protein